MALAALAGVFLHEGAANDNDSADTDAVDSVEAPSSGEYGPPDQVSESRVDLAQALVMLPERLTKAQHAVFVRSLIGYDTAEIAAELNVSEGAVRLRLMHARRRLAM